MGHGALVLSVRVASRREAVGAASRREVLGTCTERSRSIGYSFCPPCPPLPSTDAINRVSPDSPLPKCTHCVREHSTSTAEFLLHHSTQPQQCHITAC